MPQPISRRAALAWIGLATLPAGALFAQDFEEPDPTDLVARRFSRDAFSRLSDNDLYMVNLAISRGRRILIEGFSASESRAIIETAAKDRAAAMRMLR